MLRFREATWLLVMCVFSSPRGPFTATGPTLASASLNADYFGAPEILEDSRNPLSFTVASGDIVTAGHFRGVLKQGVKSVCNALTCYKMPKIKYASRGWSDIFVSKYNASRMLQWTVTAGGNGDDKARAVGTNFDGNILVTGYITGLHAKFGSLRLSSRSALSKTIFIASYSPSGSILYVTEAASCVTGKCDVTALSTDETGTILTGKFRDRMSFGVKYTCTDTAPVQCIPTEAASISMITNPEVSFGAHEKSTGSGYVFTEFCWVAKYNNTGHYLWHKFCDDPSLEADVYKPLNFRSTTFEQAEWSKRASAFFTLNPKDPTGLLGKESAYAEYASRRVPYGI